MRHLVTGTAGFIGHHVADAAETAQAFADLRPERVIHLATQAGMRSSITIPAALAWPATSAALGHGPRPAPAAWVERSGQASVVRRNLGALGAA
jgi:UDP-glucose 4-epimerase